MAEVKDVKTEDSGASAEAGKDTTVTETVKTDSTTTTTEPGNTDSGASVKEDVEMKVEDTEVKMEDTTVKSEDATVTTEDENTKTEDGAVETPNVETKSEEPPNVETKSEEPETKDVTQKTEASPLEKKIIKQIEFYFGDINLGRDKFLQGQLKEDDGWVLLKTLLTFNRLKTLSEDAGVIVAALEKSDSGLMQVHESKEKVRRHPDKPLPVFNKDRKQDLKIRSVYVKGFPLEMKLEEVEAFFEPFGTIEHIQMRRDAERKFKGSVFVLFRKEEDAKTFMGTEDVKCGDIDLIRHFKDDYFKKKNEEKKSKKEEDLKEEEDKKKVRDDEKESFQNRITKGTVLHLQGLPDGLTVEELRTSFSQHGDVAWVEYQRGDPHARIRFSTEEEAPKALEKAKEAGEGKVKVKDSEVTAHVLEGDEEIQFWKALFQGQRDRKERAKRGRRGWGGRGGGPPSKKRRTQ